MSVNIYRGKNDRKSTETIFKECKECRFYNAFTGTCTVKHRFVIETFSCDGFKIKD